MARVGKMPVVIPKGVEIMTSDGSLTVKGGKSMLSVDIPLGVDVEVNDGRAAITVKDTSAAEPIAGTVRALLNNMVIGVTKGFEKRLTLVGVGYRAQAQAGKLGLTLGFSHPVEYRIPEGVTVETPTQSEIVIKGADKGVVGQVAADIRSYRPPEPYKGKGIRYVDERIVMKEAKKK